MIFIMVTRGRGVRRSSGRGRNVPPQSSPSCDISPPLQPSQHSPGATSASGPLTSAGLPTSIPLTTGGASASVQSLTDPPLSIPYLADPPTNSPNVVPSSRESFIETNRRELICVAFVPELRRFLPPKVTRDIMYNVASRMPIPANMWRNYLANMKDTLFKNFMDKYRFVSDYDRGMTRTIWERTCMDRYPDHLNRARDKALEKAN